MTEDHLEILWDVELACHCSLGTVIPKPVQSWMRHVEDVLQRRRGIDPRNLRFAMFTDGRGGEIWRPVVLR